MTRIGNIRLPWATRVPVFFSAHSRFRKTQENVVTIAIEFFDRIGQPKTLKRNGQLLTEYRKEQVDHGDPPTS